MTQRKQLQQIRAFLFDVDKTLTNTRGEVSPRTQAAIQALAQKGFRVGVCTGRGYARIHRHILPFFPNEGLHIVSGGSQVVNTDGEIQFSRALPKERVEELIAAAQRYGVEFLFDAGSSTYASPKLAQQLGFLNYTQGEITEVPNFVAYYLNQPFREWISRQEFSVIEHESAALHTSLFDITMPGVSKETGVQAWSELLKISPAEIAGFGDSYNDITFHAAVGWSVAMGNAVSELKEKAQAIIGHTDEDGLAQYIEQNWLRK